MAFISAATIITSISLFHLTLAFFFLTSPGAIADQTLVFILGEAMGMPYERSFDQQSAPLAFLSAILLYLGLSDIVAISLPEEISAYHWGSQAPIRLFITGGLAFYSWAFSGSSPLNASRTYQASGWGEGLKNRVLFTWAFLEMVTWFWIFVTLREERRDLLIRMQQKRAAEEDRL